MIGPSCSTQIAVVHAQPIGDEVTVRKVFRNVTCPAVPQFRAVKHGSFGAGDVRGRSSLFAGNSAKQLLAVIPLANFIIFGNYVSVTEGMQEPA